MKEEFLPLFTAPSVILNRKTVFHKIDERVVVKAPGRLVRQLVALYDGTRTHGEVVRHLEKEWDKEALRGLLRTLRQKRVLVDARRLGEEVWRAVENPARFSTHITDVHAVELTECAHNRHRSNPSDTVYPAKITPLGTLLNRRQSACSFSGTSVAFQSVINMLWSSYGEIAPHRNEHSRKTVPSAGALYPLVIHTVLFKHTGNLRPAVYSVYLGSSEAVGFQPVSDDMLRFSRAFLDPVMLEKAHGVIVISGSFRVTGEKYGNRSMLYVPLEAGHAAQNVHLAALEQNVAAVEIGGFVEELLAEAINLPSDYRPLTTIVFGCEGNAQNMSELETDWVVPMAGQYRPPFAIALARVSEKINEDWSYGRDREPSLAYIKAVAEAREWAACGCVSDTLTKARLTELEAVIDPRTVIRFHPAQYRLKYFPFTPLDETKTYTWAEGTDEFTGSAVHILADLVYFPYYPDTPLYAYANSSGVAAHPDRQKAVETSMLELIERDAFMNTYLAKLATPTVPEGTLPEVIRQRLRELQRHGFRVWIKDHSLDLSPVVFVLAQNEKLAYTACASCASFDVEHALDHALMEVEASVLARLQNGRAIFKRPCEVAMPNDHGALYEQKLYFHRADFLFQGGRKTAFQDVGRYTTRSWQELLDRFQARGWRLLTVPLSLSEEYGGNSGLHIIRSIVPGMVPMTFGYRLEPAGMERIYAVANEFGNKNITYRDLPKFPHPFA